MQLVHFLHQLQVTGTYSTKRDGCKRKVKKSNLSTIWYHKEVRGPQHRFKDGASTNPASQSSPNQALLAKRGLPDKKNQVDNISSLIILV